MYDLMYLWKYINVDLCIYANQQECIYGIVLLWNYVWIYLCIEYSCVSVRLCIDAFMCGLISAYVY